ncbi:MAG: putative aldolase LsrF [Planctomycetes bacterium ADurb.Bin126]|nr:MAG: putative aldolase LsrF [Planctomycetes bacterium ADurb.Bin126]HOD83897.1 3-hydroxy-5-phosphonooxypentane-2,4-dione thiolase [Phycisphaerae bacterium]HQL75490.1 3-hydroxy-5-phosphonooxypentane-2,4-dione thiolase [Phycisphaerae bacterium]
MADTDNIKDGKDFGIGVPPAKQAFFLKGMDHADWGLKDRMARIFNKTSGNTVMLAFDHGYIMGPTSGLERIDLSIVPLIPYADCLMCTRGALRAMVPPDSGKPVCLRSSAGSTILTELNDECILDIQDILRVNASAAAVMVSIGGKFEALTIRNLTTMCDLGYRYGVPVMGVTAVGKEMTRDARYFSMASRVCAENGASIVKTYFCEGFEKVAACCPVPIVIAGGKKVPEAEALEFAYQAIQSGANGVDMGRNVFQSDAPAAMIQAIRAVVHQGAKPKDAFDLFNTLKNQK